MVGSLWVAKVLMAHEHHQHIHPVHQAPDPGLSDLKSHQLHLDLEHPVVAVVLADGLQAASRDVWDRESDVQSVSGLTTSRCSVAPREASCLGSPGPLG